MRPPITSPQTSTSSGQRAHERVVVKVPAILKIPEVRSGTYLITVLDASKMGLRISCPIAIAPGTRVEVRFGGVTVMGTARYARDMDRDFNVGIEAHAVEDQFHSQTEEFDLTSLLNHKR
jgi:hypothetical protein